MSTGLGQDPGQRQAWGVARLGQPALRDKESDAQSDEDTQGRRLPGKGNNTFFSHREVGVTAGFAGSNHLLEQGSLEIRQLRERKTLKRVKTSYARGGGGVGWGGAVWATGARTFQNQAGIKALVWLPLRPPGRPREGCPVLPGPGCCWPRVLPRAMPDAAPSGVWRGSGLCRAWPRMPNCILVSCQGDTLAERISGPLSPACWQV